MYNGQDEGQYYQDMGNAAEAEAQAAINAEAESEAAYQQSIQPDTAISVLELFSTSKEGIISFSSKVINDVEDGKVSALRVKLLSKVLKEVAEKIDEGTKEKQAKEALQYGDKPFGYFGSEMHFTAVKTEYSYENCNDPIYKELEQQQKELKAKLDERQKFLKSIKDSQTIVTGEGEIVTVYPPSKRQWDGVKTTIK